MSEILTFTQAIQRATTELMEDNEDAHVLGLGADYPNGLDGTMGQLATRFRGRVHDTPCSENAVTGMAVGMAVSGLRPIVHHGRIEFALHASDQILTQAAKWNYMFGGNYACPLTARIALGRQWGNGPQHTMTNKTMFSIPGMSVLCPWSPENAYWLLKDAVAVNYPVIYLEPRWLYKTKQTVPSDNEDSDFAGGPFSNQSAQRLFQGNDITIVAVGDAVLDVLKANIRMRPEINADIFALTKIYPLQIDQVIDSANRTGRLLVVDYSQAADTIGNEILAKTMISFRHRSIRDTALLLCEPTACPTAPSLTKTYYPDWQMVLNTVFDMCGRIAPRDLPESTFQELNLPPTDNFDTLLSVE